MDFKPYIAAAHDAAKRTRTITIVLVVASVIVFVGFYNSLDSAWMLQRIRAAYDPKSEFTDKKLHAKSKPDLNAPSQNNEAAQNQNNETPAKSFRKDFQSSLVKAYVDSTYFIKAPFFGIVLDVNDVGFIGGIGLFCILVLLRFSLSREIKNLNFVVEESVTHSCEHESYYELAMLQVFTIPEMRGETRNRLLSIAPRIVCLLPALVYLFGVAYDYYTIFWLQLFGWKENLFLVVFEAICLIALSWLSIRCWERLSYINNIWDRFWSRLNGKKSRVIRLDSDLIEDFGTDDLANEALRQVLAGKMIEA